MWLIFFCDVLCNLLQCFQKCWNSSLTRFRNLRRAPFHAFELLLQKRSCLLSHWWATRSEEISCHLSVKLIKEGCLLLFWVDEELISLRQCGRCWTCLSKRQKFLWLENVNETFLFVSIIFINQTFQFKIYFFSIQWSYPYPYVLLLTTFIELMSLYAATLL